MTTNIFWGRILLILVSKFSGIPQDPLFELYENAIIRRLRPLSKHKYKPLKNLKFQEIMSIAKYFQITNLVVDDVAFVVSSIARFKSVFMESECSWNFNMKELIFKAEILEIILCNKPARIFPRE